jgi:hypothetical protein
MNLYKLLLTTALLFSSVNALEISGQAFVKQADGRVITCAGESVYLHADTRNNMLQKFVFDNSKVKLAKEMIEQTNNPVEKAKRKEIYSKRIKTRGKSWDNMLRGVNRGEILKTTCDAQGNFIFKELVHHHDGYFIVTRIYWLEADKMQGGIYGKYAPPSDKEKVRVLIFETR